MPRRALLVGIDTYDNAGQLSACVADAQAMADALARHKGVDRRLNYECRTMLDRTDQGQKITRAALRAACRELFADCKNNDALLQSCSARGLRGGLNRNLLQACRLRSATSSGMFFWHGTMPNC